MRHLLAAAAIVAAGTAHATEFAWPTVEGAYISAHYDHAASGVLDYTCGARTYDGHRGTDIAGQPRNTPIYAGADGTVIHRLDGFGDGYWGDWSGGGFGNHVRVFHPDGTMSLYAHMNAYSGLPQVGDAVSCLDAIGGVGTSGNSTGLHVHFEVRVGSDGSPYSGTAIDPFAGPCSDPDSAWVDQNGGAPHGVCDDGYVNPPDFCDGKVNGLWCDGDDLVDCQGMDVASRETCAYGCLSMPLGTPDACAAAPAGFCTGLMDGLWCDGDDLVECDGDVELSRFTCTYGCTSMPLGTPDQCASAPAGFCAGLMDGLWCDGDDLVECQGDVEVWRDTCPYGCTSMPLGTPDQCAADDTCVGLMNGDWCDGDDLVTCSNDQVLARQTCAWGCTSMPLGTPDECAPDPGAGACLQVGVGPSPTAPVTSCNYMDWDLSPDGYYLISRFGADTDPTTWGRTTTCGYLQGHYDYNGCRYDVHSGGCLDYDDQIPWVQGHVDWIAQDMFDANLAHPYPADVPHPEYFYVAGAQRFGCGAVLRVSLPTTGRCVVVYAEDGGPGQTYEGPSYGGRRILDASPAVSDYLGATQWGWLNADEVYVEWGLPGDVPGQSCTPCQSTPADDASAANLTPWDPNHMQWGLDCR